MYTPIIHRPHLSGVATALAAALLGHPLGARAIDLGYGDWQAHGFLSQGYTYTSANNFFGNSQGDGSLEFTELGLNVLGHPLPNLLFAVQGLYRDAGGSDDLGFRLDYANLDYSLPVGESVMLGVRAGRVKNPFGFYNEGRDAIWNRPGVSLPQSVYLDSLGLRQAEISSDGGILYGRWGFGNHALSAEFLVSSPLDDTGGAADFLTGIPAASEIFPGLFGGAPLRHAPGTLEGRPLFIGRAGYEWQEGRFKLLFTAVDLDRDFESNSARVRSGNFKAFVPLASAQVNLEDFSFTSEYAQFNFEQSGFTPGGVLIETTTENYYLQVQYRFAQSWSMLARYDAMFLNIDDHDGSAQARVTGLPRHRFYAKDLTFGLRWEFIENWLVAAEYHNVDGTAWLSPVDNPGINNPALVREVSDGHWDLFTLMFSYRF